MLNFISRHLVYSYYWKTRGLDVLQRLSVLRNQERESFESLQSIQWALLKNLLRHAYSHVPFYRKRMQLISCHPDDIETMDDFARLPLLTKDDVNRNLHELIADNYAISDMVRDSTGGSTGQNITYYEDKEELANRFAAGIRSDSWAGLNIGDKYAQVWGASVDLRRASRMKRLIDRLLLRRLFISSFRLSDEDLKKAVELINAFKPKVIIGYPTPLCRFSKYLEENHVTIHRVDGIISSAETLYDFQRNAIEKQFGSRVFNRYGCREFGVIASECENHDGLHLFTDRLFVEFLDIKGMENDPIKEIVVTDVHKSGMPFIRYRIGDIGIPSTRRCECGRSFPLMERIAGRTFDLVVGANGNFVAGTFWTLLFRSVRGIDRFQVIQSVEKKLHINLEINSTFERRNLQTIENIIKEKCGDEMEVAFDIVPEISVTSSGKFRFVVSDIAKGRLHN